MILSVGTKQALPRAYLKSIVQFTFCLSFLFKDVKVLYKQLAGSQLEELDVPLGSGLDDILEKIRIHWERDIEKNRAETGALLRTKVSTTAPRGLKQTQTCLILCSKFEGWVFGFSLKQKRS